MQCILIMWPVIEHCMCVNAFTLHMSTYICACVCVCVCVCVCGCVCVCVCVCVRWGQQNVTTSWWGAAQLLTKKASGCESVPTGQTCGYGTNSTMPVPGQEINSGFG